MPRRIIKAWHGFQFELFVALMCLSLGVPLALGFATPNSVASVFPKYAQVMWGTSLTLGGLCVVSGILWRQYQLHKYLAGLHLEFAGLLMLSTAVATSTIAVILFAGKSSVFSSSINGAFIAACISRMLAIRKEIGIIREHGLSGSQ